MDEAVARLIIHFNESILTRLTNSSFRITGTTQRCVDITVLIGVALDVSGSGDFDMMLTPFTGRAK